MELFIIPFALLIGVCTGIVLQRGRVCTNTAFRNLLLANNVEHMAVIIITVTIELVGYQILALFPLSGFTFESNPTPFSLLLLPIGGFLFGLGTVFAGGCAGGICYRIGEGSVKSLISFLGFGIGIGIITIDPFSELISNLQISTFWLINGQIPSLELILPRWVWSLITFIILIATLYYYKIQTKRLTHLLPYWTPVVSGILLGFLGIISRYFSTLSGRSFGFSTIDGIGDIFQVIVSFFGFFSSPQLS